MKWKMTVITGNATAACWMRFVALPSNQGIKQISCKAASLIAATGRKQPGLGAPVSSAGRQLRGAPPRAMELSCLPSGSPSSSLISLLP